MLDETTPKALSLWTPKLVGIMTFLIVPGGWFLGILNFHRMGLKRQVWAHLLSLAGGTLLLLVMALSGSRGSSGVIGLILGSVCGYYMFDTNRKVIDDYRAMGIVVQDANGVTGVLIGIGATVLWFISLMLLVFLVVLFQTFILDQNNSTPPIPGFIG